MSQTKMWLISAIWQIVSGLWRVDYVKENDMEDSSEPVYFDW